MYAGASIGVVVPAYNEAGLVGEVIRTVPEFVDRVYAVDDCSSDGTWAEIRRVAEAENETAERPEPATAEADGGLAFDRRVVPIRHRENRGVGGSVMTGYERALRDGVDVIAVMNGDGQMPPEILALLLGFNRLSTEFLQ